MKNKNGFILSTYVYMLLVFFLLLLVTMLAVLNNTRVLSVKLKDQSSNTSGLIDKDFSFVLLGNEELVLRINEEYVEPGYKIQTLSGTNLSEIVKVEGSVNNSVVGSYTLTYKATYNGVTKEVKRIVHVVDNNASNYLNSLYEYKSNENGLIKDSTVDKNIRYSGNYVNNYVEFGNTNELWRIIGVFNVTTTSGTTETLVKIVRDESIGNYSWDSSESSINNGYGVNEWSEADLKIELNTLYLNQESGTCYNGENNASTACDFSATGIGSTYRNMIESVVWNTGAISNNSSGISVISAYDEERGNTTGKICTSGTNCNDTVTRTTTWEGLVGLIYPSDYGFASMDTACMVNINDTTNYSCNNDNWLNNNLTHWSLSPVATTENNRNVWRASNIGRISDYYASGANDILPTLYLKSNVSIINGDGSSTNPYKLSI